ncbi:hypothetical protein AB3662_36285 [Sorangium cellulosum]
MSHVASTPKREMAEEHRGIAVEPDRRSDARGKSTEAGEAWP